MDKLFGSGLGLQIRSAEFNGLFAGASTAGVKENVQGDVVPQEGHIGCGVGIDVHLVDNDEIKHGEDGDELAAGTHG